MVINCSHRYPSLFYSSYRYPSLFYSSYRYPSLFYILSSSSASLSLSRRASLRISLFWRSWKCVPRFFIKTSWNLKTANRSWQSKNKFIFAQFFQEKFSFLTFFHTEKIYFNAVQFFTTTTIMELLNFPQFY